MSATSKDNSPKRRLWLAILGNLEAVVSAGMLLRVFTALTVVDRQQKDALEMAITIGIGAGLAVIVYCVVAINGIG